MQSQYVRWLEIGLFVSGIILWGFSIEFSLNWMAILGLALVGAGLVLSGFKAMSAGELGMWRGRYGVTQDRGLTARLFGLAFSLMGGALLAYVAARILGWDQRIGAFLADRPGYVMVPAGLLLIALGAANLIGAWNRRGSVMGIFQSLKNWFWGFISLVIGLAMLCTGMVEWIAPEAFDRWLESTLGSIHLVSF